ncbi:hypothetical protein [Shewanella sp.]|uniref:hypothetical protein n=1 Tax=Shewanella sp. TaxID=50422 RepID=UPI003A8B0649
MSLPVTVYRWDDAGAPQLTNGKPSEIIAILKKCLVEGYGTKAGAGWSVAFENAAAFKIAFRNSTTEASGGFVQFWSVDGTDANSGNMRFRGAKSMTALDTFIDAQYQMQFSISTVVDYWVLIATSAGFWFLSTSTLTNPNPSTNAKGLFFVGDFDAFTANDPGRFVNIMNGVTSDMTSYSWSLSFEIAISGSTTICKVYDADGSANFANYKMDPRYNVGTQTIAGVPTGDRVFFQPLIISTVANVDANDRLGVINTNSIIQPYIRGKVPGLLHSPSTGYSDQPWPVIESINGQQHMLMPGYRFGRTWINLETWYA